MKTKEEIKEWLRANHIFNRVKRNMHYCHPEYTLDYLIEYFGHDILMFAFDWLDCNSRFSEDIDWCSFSTFYCEWYNER